MYIIHDHCSCKLYMIYMLLYTLRQLYVRVKFTLNAMEKCYTLLQTLLGEKFMEKEFSETSNTLIG